MKMFAMRGSHFDFFFFFSGKILQVWMPFKIETPTIFYLGVYLFKGIYMNQDIIAYLISYYEYTQNL